MRRDKWHNRHYELLKPNTILKEQINRFDTQNTLLVEQINGLGLQNRLLQTQALMQEANRFAAYTSILASIIKKIYAESQENENRPSVVNLSEDLVNEITSLLTQLKPYTYVESSLDSGEISTVYLSPERGHILRALVNNNVNFSVFENADFTYADMRQAYLSKSTYMHTFRERDYPCGTFDTIHHFDQINLSHSDWTDARLGAVALSYHESMVMKNATLVESRLEVKSSVGFDLSNVNIASSAVYSHVPISFESVSISAWFDYLEAPCLGAIGDNLSLESLGAAVDLDGVKFHFYGYSSVESLKEVDWDELSAQVIEERYGNVGVALQEMQLAFEAGELLSSEFVLNYLVGHEDLSKEDDWRKLYARNPDQYRAKVSKFIIDEFGNISAMVEIVSVSP